MSRRVTSASRYILPSGGGGGTSLYNIQLEEINLTDGSWTLFDPNSLVNAVAFASNFNEVTWNALSNPSADFNWSAGANILSPRWYKTLTIDGNNVTNEDLVLVTTRLELDSLTGDFNQQVVVGAAIDPDSTVLLTLDGSGGAANRVGTGGRAYGTWQVNGATTGLSANNVFSVATVQRGFNAVGSGAYLNIGSGTTPDTINAGSRNSNQNSASGSTVNLSIIVGIGPRSSTDTIAAGNKQKFKAAIRAVNYGGLV
jgi:hypothetical protein